MVEGRVVWAMELIERRETNNASVIRIVCTRVILP
jgi:hypothetical protein